MIPATVRNTPQTQKLTSKILDVRFVPSALGTVVQYAVKHAYIAGVWTRWACAGLVAVRTDEAKKSTNRIFYYRPFFLESSS